MNINYITLEGLKSLAETVKNRFKEDFIRDMTSKEAIKELQVIVEIIRDKILFNKDNFPEKDNFPLKKQVKANELAIEALNKETPQKIIVTYDYLGFEKCPRCKYGNLLTRDYVQFEYCPMCGQKLEWN